MTDKGRTRKGVENSESCANCVFCRGGKCKRYPSPKRVDRAALHWCGEHERDAGLDVKGEKIKLPNPPPLA